MKKYLLTNKFIQRVFKDKPTIILLFLMVFAGLYLRTHFGTDYYTFGDEAIRDASVAFVGAKEIQFPLTGPFSSLGPFTFGPWYYYQLIFSYLLIPSFWAPWMSLTLFSLLFILVVYKIGALIQDKYLGLIAALFATVSIAQLDASRVLTNPSLVGFLSALVLLLAIKVYKGSRSGWTSGAWGFITGITIFYHYQAFWLLTLGIFALTQLKKNPKIVLYYALGLLVAALPTLFFEANNHWITSWSVWRYLAYDQYRIYLPNRWLTYLTVFIPNFFGSVIGTFLPLTIGIIVLSVIVFVRDFLKRKLPREVIYLLISTAIIFITLRYYRGERSFGYLQFFHVYIFIFTAYMVRNLYNRWKNISAFVLCSIIVVSAFIWQSKNFSKDSKNYKSFLVVSDLEKKWPNEKYNWYVCGRLPAEITSAISLVQQYSGRIDKNGKKIAFFNEDCPLPPPADPLKIKKEKIINANNEIYPAIQLTEMRLLDLSAASESALLENNWYRLNPKIVSDQTTKWWFRERP